MGDIEQQQEAGSLLTKRKVPKGEFEETDDEDDDENGGDFQATYKRASYGFLILMVFGHVASLVIYLLLIAERNLVGFWYAIVFWPIYTGLALILFEVFMRLYYNATSTSTAEYHRIDSPRYVWTVSWGRIALWGMYVYGLVMAIVIGINLGFYFDPNDGSYLDANTHQYNFLIEVLAFISYASLVILGEVLYVYMYDDLYKPVVVEGAIILAK